MEYWKYKAIDKLKDYTAQKAALQNLPEEIKRLESEACSIKSATARQVYGYMLDRVVNAPTTIHRDMSVILIMPFLRMKVRMEKYEEKTVSQ